LDWMDVGRPKLVAATHAAEVAVIERILFSPGRIRADRLVGMRAWCAAAGLAALLAPVANAQVIKDELWNTNGSVSAIAASGNLIYIGGSFTSVGPASGGGVPLSAATGRPTGPYPRVGVGPTSLGNVWAVAPDGTGGWYVAGHFLSVGGEPHSNLAHILANGSIAPWSGGPSSQVLGITASGSRVYMARGSGVVAWDDVTGAPLAGFSSPVLAGGAYSIATDGTNVYVGGFNGLLVAMDAATGAQVWSQAVTGSAATVYALALGGPTLYVGGRFTGVGGQPRNRVAALDAATGALKAWDPNSGSVVMALATDGSTVYAGGSFTTMGGQPRNRMAAIDAASGAVGAWNPDANAIVYALAVSGSTVYAGGAFSTIGGQTRNRIAALDASTGAATAWDPRANNEVRAVAASGSMVYVGGVFTSMGDWLPRNNLAALDATTGNATAWDPGVTGFATVVDALAVDGSTIYAGGRFTNAGGQARHNIAALDATTGAATAWDASTSGDWYVYDIVRSGSAVYAVGSFFDIGGQTRRGIAALDAVTGAATAWNPNPNSEVNSLAVSGSRVYAGGQFTSIGGQTRNRLAALDVASGNATSWDPNLSGGNNFVNSIVPAGSTVYVGGDFTNIGGQSRNDLAALDATTGAATGWDPGPDATVGSIVIDGSTVYVGGGFSTIAGEARYGMAALDAVSGAATGWNPSPTPGGIGIGPLVMAGSTVYVGGNFTGIDQNVRGYVAAITSGTVSVPQRPATSTLELTQNRPNPAGTSTLIEFTLPQAAPVKLGVFDLQGRRVATLLDGAMRPAGANRIPFRAAGLASGVYMYRVEALGHAATRKMIVVE